MNYEEAAPLLTTTKKHVQTYNLHFCDCYFCRFFQLASYCSIVTFRYWWATFFLYLLRRRRNEITLRRSRRATTTTTTTTAFPNRAICIIEKTFSAQNRFNRFDRCGKKLENYPFPVIRLYRFLKPHSHKAYYALDCLAVWAKQILFYKT